MHIISILAAHEGVSRVAATVKNGPVDILKQILPACSCIWGVAICLCFAGFGSQKLQTLAAYALRKNLLVWLELHQVKLLEAGKEKELKEMREVNLPLQPNQLLSVSLKA